MRSRPQMLIENVQEPLGALEAGEERELLADATHLHLLFPGLALIVFCYRRRLHFLRPGLPSFCLFFFLLETRLYPSIFFASDWQNNVNVMLFI